MPVRFFRRGISKFKFMTTYAGYATATAPTSAEESAAQDLTPQVADATGWEYKNSPISVPDFSSSFVPTIGGEDKPGNPTLVFYDITDTSNPIRTALPKGTTGYMLLKPYGAGAGLRNEVWPVTVIAATDAYANGNTAAQWHAEFAVTAKPLQNLTATQ